MDNLIGQVLGRYRIQALLSQGRLGNIYQGIDVNLERPVALKVLHPTVTSQPDFASRFTALARAAVRLEHPGIVPVLDFGMTAEQTYLAMRLLEGPTLARVLHDLRANQQWLALPTALQLVRQVGLALDYLQRQGVTQRQVLPTKIMFKWENPAFSAGDEAQQPILIDLGLSTLLGERSPLQKQVNLQQLAYLPPEAILGKTMDGRGEVYALGALLYELTVGQPPLVVRTVGEAVDAHLNQTIPPPQALHPVLPASVAALIEQALAHEPAQRFATMREMVDGLVALSTSTLPSLVPPGATAGAGPLTQQVRQAPVAPTPAPPEAEEPTARLNSEEQPVSEPMPTLAVTSVYSPLSTPQPIDQIQIIAPDSTMRTVEVNQATLTIGRINDNDLVLDDPRISRKHARLEVEDGQWRVVDLHSANGTFIGKARVPPGGVTAWSDDQLLRVGNYRLRLVRGQNAAAVASVSPPTVSARPAQRAAVYIPSLRAEVAPQEIQNSADGISVGLFIKESEFSVDPGNRLSIPLVVLNQKTGPGLFTLSVTGIPSTWYHFTPARCEIGAKGQAQVVLEIEPPRLPQTRPGRYSLQVTVASQQPEQRALGEIQLTVKPYIRFRAEAQPPIVTVGEPMRISIENEGNQLQHFKLMWWEEPAGELNFADESAELQILPGDSDAIEIQADVRKQRWLGGERAHLVKVQISTQQHAVQHLVVKMVSRGRLR